MCKKKRVMEENDDVIKRNDDVNFQMSVNAKFKNNDDHNNNNDKVIMKSKDEILFDIKFQNGDHNNNINEQRTRCSLL